MYVYTYIIRYIYVRIYMYTHANKLKGDGQKWKQIHGEIFHRKDLSAKEEGGSKEGGRQGEQEREGEAKVKAN